MKYTVSQIENLRMATIEWAVASDIVKKPEQLNYSVLEEYVRTFMMGGITDQEVAESTAVLNEMRRRGLR